MPNKLHHLNLKDNIESSALQYKPNWYVSQLEQNVYVAYLEIILPSSFKN